MKGYCTTYRREWDVGHVIKCGSPPTSGRDHRPFEGEHVATVTAKDDARDTYRVECRCGHMWNVPQVMVSRHMT